MHLECFSESKVLSNSPTYHLEKNEACLRNVIRL